MGKLYFNYGTMNSSKTANLLMVAHNYESQGRRILCLKPSSDTRWNGEDGRGQIVSRAIEKPLDCFLVSEEENLFELIRIKNLETQKEFSKGFSAVLIDEAQFLTEEQVKQLAEVVDKLGISVLCYGLKNRYTEGELFTGTKALLYYAHSIQEIKTICKYCNNKATMNLRVVDGYAIYSGDEVDIGDVVGKDDFYAQVCYHHYMNPPAPIVSTKRKRRKNVNFDAILEYILHYKNEIGYYLKASVPDDMYFDRFYCLNNKSKLRNLRYICIGPVMMDLQKYGKQMSNSKSEIVNGRTIFMAVVQMLYDIFESNHGEAFKILKESTCANIDFFETEDEYFESYNAHTGNSLKRFHKLPDGRYYYYDLHTKDFKDFTEKLFASISEHCNEEKVGFIFVEDDINGFEISEEN